jgi:hypothetical protein
MLKEAVALSEPDFATVSFFQLQFYDEISSAVNPNTYQENC